MLSYYVPPAVAPKLILLLTVIISSCNKEIKIYICVCVYISEV